MAEPEPKAAPCASCAQLREDLRLLRQMGVAIVETMESIRTRETREVLAELVGKCQTLGRVVAVQMITELSLHDGAPDAIRKGTKNG